MKIAEITFSPTGGTQKVANIITSELSGTVSKIDLTDWKTDFENIILEKEDVAVIAVPSYGGRVPALAVERIKRLHGNQTKCVLVCVYGNRAYEDTLVELNDIAEDSGFRVIAAISAIAEHSIMHQYATGRPDGKDKAELCGFAKQIMKKIDDGAAENKILDLPGNHPYKKSGGSGLVPKTKGNCINCGLCAKKCPAQAISYENNQHTDGSKCISCMRCVSICPQSARTLNKLMVSAVALAMKKVCSKRKNNELFL
ncbi:MAG: EFR1 family ferrodoxin [Eubacteriales bacterium]|nr:EFR1 family ferrodoxin [Eubacteriales bacterium]